MVLRNFIVFEGVDGSGTSTQLDILKKRLEGRRAWFTAEPSSGAIGAFIRSILRGDAAVSQNAAALLFAADRQEHVFGTNGVYERASAGELVVCDRYLFSSLAYQSDSLKKGEPTLAEKVNENFPLPEFLFYFDIDPRLALERIQSRAVKEIYEKESVLRGVAERYRFIMDSLREKQSGAAVITIDASESVERVSEKLWNIIGNLPILKNV